VRGDQPDVGAGVGLDGDRDRAAAHLGQGGAVVVDLDGEQPGREGDEVGGVADRAAGQPGHPDPPCVGVGGDLLVPGAVEQRDEVGERGGVADLLHRERVGCLVVDRCRQPGELAVVGGRRGRSGRRPDPEQVLHVPRHHLEHRNWLPWEGPRPEGAGGSTLGVWAGPARRPGGIGDRRHTAARLATASIVPRAGHALSKRRQATLDNRPLSCRARRWCPRLGVRAGGGQLVPIVIDAGWRHSTPQASARPTTAAGVVVRAPSKPAGGRRSWPGASVRDRRSVVRRVLGRGLRGSSMWWAGFRLVVCSLLVRPFVSMGVDVRRCTVGDRDGFSFGGFRSASWPLGGVARVPVHQTFTITVGDCRWWPLWPVVIVL
jgi:hypothetical protein